jgi:hypothetical protein
MSDPALYGIVGEFDVPEHAIAAARQLRDTGFSRLDAYSPYPVEALEEAILPRRGSLIPSVVFLGAVLGAALGYCVQYYAAAVSYPLNIGGRPLDSWPAFIVSGFEITVLFALTAGFVVFLAASRLPLFYHPIFRLDAFGRASQDRFFLCIEARDPRFHEERVHAILARHGAAYIGEVRR